MQIPTLIVTGTESHVTLRIHLMYSMPTFDTLFSIIIMVGISLNVLNCKLCVSVVYKVKHK